MTRSRCATSPRLRASQALALAVLIMAAVLFGTPGRRDGHEAMAQAPPMSPPSTRPATPRSTVPFPVPPELQGIDLSRQTAEEAAARSAGCVTCHRGQHEPHGKPETVRLGCVDCHGGDPTADRPAARPRLAAIPRRLARLRPTRCGPTRF